MFAAFESDSEEEERELQAKKAAAREFSKQRHEAKKAQKAQKELDTLKSLAFQRGSTKKKNKGKNKGKGKASTKPAPGVEVPPQDLTGSLEAAEEDRFKAELNDALWASLADTTPNEDPTPEYAVAEDPAPPPAIPQVAAVAPSPAPPPAAVATSAKSKPIVLQFGGRRTRKAPMKAPRTEESELEALLQQELQQSPSRSGREAALAPPPAPPGLSSAPSPSLPAAAPPPGLPSRHAWAPAATPPPGLPVTPTSTPTPAPAAPPGLPVEVPPAIPAMVDSSIALLLKQENDMLRLQCQKLQADVVLLHKRLQTVELVDRDQMLGRLLESEKKSKALALEVANLHMQNKELTELVRRRQ